MNTGRKAWYRLAVLAALASFGPGIGPGVGADPDDAPKPLPPAAVKSWRAAGAVAGWMIDVPPRPTGGYEYWEPFREEAEPVAVPAFRFSQPQKEGALAGLPDPGVAFGLDLHCWSGDDARLKEFAG